MNKKNSPHTVIAIVGPTGSGKTACAVELAKKLETEILSADSRQIFKEFDIATAKPTKEEMQNIKHHFIDIISPVEEYTVANFADEARNIMNELFNKGKIPIVAGGTGLYFRILLENYDMPRVAPNKELRQELQEIADTQGVEKIYQMLYELDPEIAQKMHPNNTVKIIRALEVCKTLNMPMSQVQKVKKDSEYNVIWLGLNSEDRQFLYNRTDLRVDKMIEAGVEKEAKSLYEKYGKISSLMNTIAYQEFIEYFDGAISYEECVEKIKQNTRRYVKRQLTWFRRNQEINWFDIKNNSYLENLCKKALEEIS